MDNVMVMPDLFVPNDDTEDAGDCSDCIYGLVTVLWHYSLRLDMTLGYLADIVLGHAADLMIARFPVVAPFLVPVPWGIDTD